MPGYPDVSHVERSPLIHSRYPLFLQHRLGRSKSQRKLCQAFYETSQGVGGPLLQLKDTLVDSAHGDQDRAVDALLAYRESSEPVMSNNVACSGAGLPPDRTKVPIYHVSLTLTRCSTFGKSKTLLTRHHLAVSSHLRQNTTSIQDRHLRRTVKAWLQRSCEGKMEREVRAVLGTISVDEKSRAECHITCWRSESSIERLPQSRVMAQRTRSVDRYGFGQSTSLNSCSSLARA